VQLNSILAADSEDAAFSRERGAVTARLAERNHELRAALYGIESSAAGLSLYRDRLSSGQVDELIDGMVAEIRRVRDLLDDRAAPAAIYDLGDAFRPAISCARASGLEVSFFLPPGVEVEGRRESATQVLVALLDNVRAHADCSRVDVLVAPLDDVVMVFVEDRGCGMPAALRRRVFERGVRGGESEGSGLGLHIAQRLMTEQGGSISVRPRRGGGTTFVMRFRRPQP
jgi:signal transduction histidine kinase